MFGSFERMVAFRYLRARRSEGFVSVIAGFSFAGIMLGVATLIIVMSVMNGFRIELLDRILGVNGHMTVFSPAGLVTDYQALADRLEEVEGVVHAYPQIQGQVMIQANNAASGALVRGMTREDFTRRTLLSDNILRGGLDAFEGRNTVFLGSRLAQRFGVTVGDKVTLISAQSQVTAFGSVPRLKAYEVGGIFQVGMYEYDNGFIYMPLEAAQVFFKQKGAAGTVEILTEDPDSVDDLRFPVLVKAGTDLQVSDWRDANASFFNAVEVERNVMFLILTLIIIVAAFNIISSLIMLVKDKGRDIAILRTMGASRGMIMRIFLMTGAAIGVSGTLAGFLLGLLFCLNIEEIRQVLETLTGTNLFQAEIYFLSRLPAVVDPSEVVLVVAMGLGLSFLATLYPSWRAARLEPVEALRYE
ncbi:MAG: lipoprotein-releasing ABC transporter permease subunit [Alphaproteobacteria bacterium]|nr:lipoprotein-releasing ABC transporter permease subunit [Alphaproteobacteria bacterium]